MQAVVIQRGGHQAGNCGPEIEKGATAAPFFSYGRSCYRFFAAFFLAPPLAFFAMMPYPPLHPDFSWRGRPGLPIRGCRLARPLGTAALCRCGTFRAAPDGPGAEERGESQPH